MYYVPHFRIVCGCLEAIDRLSTEKWHKHRFVFGFLSDEEFGFTGGKNDFSRMGKELYVRLNKKSIVYNCNLKKVQKKAGIRGHHHIAYG